MARPATASAASFTASVSVGCECTVMAMSSAEPRYSKASNAYEKLVDSYLALPDQSRTGNAESTRRFVESMGIVADEMEHLLQQCCHDRQSAFDTHSRFIESRYREDDNLRGN